jgi:hypothetical protein
VIVLDTTVLVYAVGSDHPLRAPCRELVAAMRDGRLRATTTPEVIQEFAQVRSRRRPRADAVSLAVDFAHLLAPLLIVDQDDLHAGLDISPSRTASVPSTRSLPPPPCDAAHRRSSRPTPRSGASQGCDTSILRRRSSSSSSPADAVEVSGPRGSVSAAHPE